MPYAKANSAVQLPQTVVDCLTAARHGGRTVVLATGVFDILHQEHHKFLEKAKAAGEVLLVGLESDKRVTELKGPGRPVNSEQTRLENLEQWHIADVVFVLPDEFGSKETTMALIETIRPQILAVSANSPFIDKKQAVMEGVGGEVRIVHEHNPAISTTQIIAERNHVKN